MARPSSLPHSFLMAVTVTFLPGCHPTASLPDGVVATFGGFGLENGAFSYPRAITAEPDGSVFVVDKSGRIQRFSADGAFETGWRMPETEHGKPIGLSVHPDGRLFVADTHYHRVMVFDRDGRFLASLGREGTGDGEMQLPTDVAFDADGYVYVGEYQGNDRITKWSPNLAFVKALAEEPMDGKRLRRPAGLAVDREQTLWIADACNHRIVRLSREGELLATFGRFGSSPGEMRYPYDIAVTPDDQIMICEYEGNRLQWFSKEGRSLRIWGRGGRRPGELFAPWGAAYGPRGRIYIVDSLNSRVQIVGL
jgi:DNA-binding beta-propeller fold protein YncE